MYALFSVEKCIIHFIVSLHALRAFLGPVFVPVKASDVERTMGAHPGVKPIRLPNLGPERPIVKMPGNHLPPGQRVPNVPFVRLFRSQGAADCPLVSAGELRELLSSISGVSRPLSA